MSRFIRNNEKGGERGIGILPKSEKTPCLGKPSDDNRHFYSPLL